MKHLIAGLFLLLICPPVSAETQLTYGEVKSLDSKAFSAKREYYVHLPDGYDSKQDRKYPTLYVLHGQWDLLSTVAVIDAISNAIPQLLIVGVNSKGPELRPSINADGSVNIEGQQFKSFFEGELVPHIGRTYRVAGFNILSGHSNSGRFVMNSFLDNPNMFSAYFVFSPSLEDGVINEKALENVSSFTNADSIFIMTLANEGQHMEVPYQELVALFESQALASGKFFHREFPELTHASTKIVSMIFALETLFDGWQPPGSAQRDGLVGLQRHYSGLSQKYGFEVEIPLQTMLRGTYFYSISEDVEKNELAAALVKFAIDRDPASTSEFIDLVQMMNNQEQEEGAQRLTAYICSTVEQHEFCSQSEK